MIHQLALQKTCSFGTTFIVIFLAGSSLQTHYSVFIRLQKVREIKCKYVRIKKHCYKLLFMIARICSHLNELWPERLRASICFFSSGGFSWRHYTVCFSVPWSGGFVALILKLIMLTRDASVWEKKRKHYQTIYWW